jgi:chemotaxis protein MotB
MEQGIPAESEAEPPYVPAFVSRFQSFAARKKIEDDKQLSCLWLITITDIMALMLTFFVLLYSMSSPDEQQWADMSSALNKNVSKQYAPPTESGPQDTINIDKVYFEKAQDLRYLKVVIQEALAKDPVTNNIEILSQPGRMIISMPQDLLFESGRAEVNTKGQQALFVIGGALSRIKNAIEIVGHTDPRALETNQNFRTNWDLSLARALNVAGILDNVGYGKPVTVRGMSSARYDDLGANIPEDRRLDLSRRVDIVILKDKGKVRAFFDIDP